jgi:hypothetical protein
MNGYQELREIHALSQEAIVIFDSGEFPSRTIIARIREIAGVFPKYGSDDEYIREREWGVRFGENDVLICSSREKAEQVKATYFGNIHIQLASRAKLILAGPWVHADTPSDKEKA